MEFCLLLQSEFERKGLKTVQQKAERSGFNTEYLRQVLHGHKVPSDDMIVEACVKMKLSAEKTRELLIAAAKDRAKSEATKEFLEGFLALAGDIDNKVSNGRPIKLPPSDYYTVPVWSSVQAGTGQLSEKNTEVVDEVLLTAEEYKAKCFAIQITGDSMEPEIKDGDIGVFEPPDGLQPAENDVVALKPFQTTLCRQFQPEHAVYSCLIGLKAVKKDTVLDFLERSDGLIRQHCRLHLL